jgi:hypothetical protein
VSSVSMRPSNSASPRDKRQWQRQQQQPGFQFALDERHLCSSPNLPRVCRSKKTVYAALMTFAILENDYRVVLSQHLLSRGLLLISTHCHCWLLSSSPAMMQSTGANDATWLPPAGGAGRSYAC